MTIKLPPEDLFCELYRELNTAFQTPLDEATELADIVDDQEQARVSFRDVKPHQFVGEVTLVRFLEEAFDIIEELGGDALSNRYFQLISDFVEKYSLRYDMRRPFTLHPTLPGVFARMIKNLKTVTAQDPNLHGLMQDFEEALRDLRHDHSSNRIKTCIQKQINLMEGIAGSCPNVNAQTLGRMCGQVDTWPHSTLREAAEKVYGFTSNYPGIRHAGNPNGAIREIDMRDMVAVSVLLAGFSPYLSDQLDAPMIYQGGDP